MSYCLQKVSMFFMPKSNFLCQSPHLFDSPDPNPHKDKKLDPDPH
jgi:hypothetical protein